MKLNTGFSYFASAERASVEHLQRQVDLFKKSGSDNFGDAFPLICLILNANRQVVYANSRVLDALAVTDTQHIYGKRPGELFGCVHATEEAGGCGTSKYCENCGSVQAILEAQQGRESQKECRLTAEGGISEDFRVQATPIERDGEWFTIFTMQDIQHEKRREALERTFFHDLINTAGGLSGLLEVLELVDQDTEKEEVLSLITKTTSRLIDEIHSGRALSLAEAGQLTVNLEVENLNTMVKDSVEFYRSHSVCSDRFLEWKCSEEAIQLRTDKALFHRILGNLIKNALEAADIGQTVTVNLYRENGSVLVTVSSENVIPEKVKVLIFERSFSTKGKGRGIGTYSVKLFTEKYLQGRVWFESAEGMGTRFSVAFPENS